MKTFLSAISNKEYPISKRVSSQVIRTSLFEYIKEQYPNFNKNSDLSVDELNHFRHKYNSDFLTKSGSLDDLKKIVADSFQKDDLINEHIALENTNNKDTFGERLADKVANFGGSWTFILSFILFLLIWIGSNIYFLHNKGFDPYPFILLNLILSCVAALQAPIIMMSQNRQESKDRERAKNDYMINLKSELEIRILHEKIDHLMIQQQQKIMDLENSQTELMQHILDQISKLNNKSTT